MLAAPASSELFPFTDSEPMTWARRGKFKILRLRVPAGRAGVLLAAVLARTAAGARGHFGAQRCVKYQARRAPSAAWNASERYACNRL